MSPSRSRPALVCNERGLTLLEVLIAAVLLIVVMFWITQFFVQGRKHLDFEENRRKATAVAEAQLEHLREWPYDSVLTWMDSTSLDTTVILDGVSYDVQMLFGPGPNIHTTEVSAVVQWEAGASYEPSNAFTRRDTTTTLIGRRVGP